VTPPWLSESVPPGVNVPERKGDWIQTFRGLQFWPLDPRPEEILIEDIAHSLSNQCRYAGHTSKFYSVAQHSVMVARIVPRQHFAWGLLHDAAEAYLVDLPRPLKRFSPLGNVYRPIEARLMMCVCERFGLPYAEPPEVKDADNVLLMTEKRDLMPHSPAKWVETSEPLPNIIMPWKPERAECEFLYAWDEAVEMGAQ
jgi:hypothetical protein